MTSDNFNEYLQCTEIIDFNDKGIIDFAKRFNAGTVSIILAKEIYEYVRDEIKHSFDINYPAAYP